MKYLFTYYGRAIQKKEFLKNVPQDWESQINELGEFSWGGYKAIQND